ncbi:MAG: YaeQ family protein [Rubrivivax sp.]|nr:YaeQ family protein [Rubrivivax sp.]
MALKSTVFKAQLQLADIDHGCYGDHALTLARHPSETDERMMVRLVALALNAHQVHSLCGGDGRIGFGAGLCDPDDPDVLITDFTGRKRLWVEVGQPEEKPLARACSQADAVVVYAYAPSAEIWWRGIAGKVARLPRLAVWQLPAEQTQALAALAERSMQLTATVQEGAITVASERGAVHLEPQCWKAAQAA